MGKAERRPPKLEVVRHEPTVSKEPSLRMQLTRAHVTGTRSGVSRLEMLDLVRRVVAGESQVMFGLDRFEALGMDEVLDILRDVWGWTQENSRSVIDPHKTVEGMQQAVTRIREVSAKGGRVAFATGRPASLLPLMQQLARLAHEVGANVLSDTQSSEIRADGRSGRRLWWLDEVAVLTDGRSLLETDGVDAAEELLFFVQRPDLVVADRGLAGVAARDGLEAVAFADLDALALGVAVQRGARISIVPLNTSCAPNAYEPILAVQSNS